MFNLIKTSTCFKGKGSCIELIFTKRKYCFKNSFAFEAGLSEPCQLVYSMLKTCFKIEKSKHFSHRDCKKFNGKNVCLNLENKLD